MPYVWSGNGETPSITDSGNWSDGTPTGVGGEDFTFGDIAAGANHTINIPSLEEGYVSVNDLLFNGSSPLNYTFAGTAGSPLLFLQGSLTLANTGTVTFADTLSLRLSYVSNSVTITEGATLIVNSAVSGDDDGGAIAKYGAGTLALNGPNTFINGFYLHEGTLLLGRSSTGDTSEITDSPVGEGILQLDEDTTLTINSNEQVTLHNYVHLEGLGTVTLEIPDYSRLALVGTVAGVANLTKTGSGELLLSYADSEFEGGVTITGGSLVLGASSSSEGESIWGPLGSGTLALHDGTSLHVEDDSDYTLHNAVELDTEQGSSVTFNIQSAASLNLVGRLSGPASLVKSSAGALTLSGSVGDFTGNTTVDGGTLVLDDVSLYAGTATVNDGGTLTLKGSYFGNTITVNDGGTLAGNGSASEGIIGSGATLSPGFGEGESRIASLIFDELTFGQGSIMEIDIKHLGSGEFENDSAGIRAPSTLTILADEEHPLTLKLISLDALGDPGDLATGLEVGTLYSLSFLSYNTTRVGDLELGVNVVLDTSDFSADFPSADFGLFRDGNSYYLTFTPVPEPSTYALMILGLAAVGLTLRRQRRRVS